MNQRQAGNILRRNAPKGEHPAFINQQEASWLKGMGGSGRPTKSGLRSYAHPSADDGGVSQDGINSGDTSYGESGDGHTNFVKDQYADYGGATGSMQGQMNEGGKRPDETAEAYHNRMTGGGGDEVQEVQEGLVVLEVQEVQVMVLESRQETIQVPQSLRLTNQRMSFGRRYMTNLLKLWIVLMRNMREKDSQMLLRTL